MTDRHKGRSLKDVPAAADASRMLGSLLSIASTVVLLVLAAVLGYLALSGDHLLLVLLLCALAILAEPLGVLGVLPGRRRRSD